MMYMDVKEIVYILFKGYFVIFCNLRVFWGFWFVVEKKNKKNNEFGFFIFFNIIVFYVFMVYNKKRKV